MKHSQGCPSLQFSQCPRVWGCLRHSSSANSDGTKMLSTCVTCNVLLFLFWSSCPISPKIRGFLCRIETPQDAHYDSCPRLHAACTPQNHNMDARCNCGV